MRHIGSLCPHSTSIPSLPAPPTRQAISGSPATAPSTDLILWTPIGLPVSAGLHLPTLMATPISSPSGATEERNHALAQQLEYPTKDLIVWEARTGGPVDAFGSTNFVASAIVAIVIACYVYIVAKVLCACVLYTFVSDHSSNTMPGTHCLARPLSLRVQMSVHPRRSTSSSR